MLNILSRIVDDYGRRGLIVDRIDLTWRVFWFDTLTIEDLDEVIPYTILS